MNRYVKHLQAKGLPKRLIRETGSGTPVESKTSAKMRHISMSLRAMK
ncbi:MAG: hypothetical protein N2Z40_07775 [Caldimicrobium sp.]|nr:hypothetical protein [Caldimicrobium sp.]